MGGFICNEGEGFQSSPMGTLKLPLEAFLIVRTASGLPVLVVMLILSYRFPGWYWERARDNHP